MSYLSSNRKERFPIEKSGNGNARRLRSRFVVSADNRRATAAQRAADTAPSRRTLLTRGKRHLTETTPPPNRLRRTKRLQLALGGAVAGQAAGRKTRRFCPRRRPPALDKRPTKPARTCGTRCATAAQCSGGHSSSPNRATRPNRLRANRPPVERISTDGLRKELSEKPCSEDRGKRDHPLKHSHRLSHCIMGVKGQDEQPISVGFWICKGLPLTPHVAQPAKRSVYDDEKVVYSIMEYQAIRYLESIIGDNMDEFLGFDYCHTIQEISLSGVREIQMELLSMVSHLWR